MTVEQIILVCLAAGLVAVGIAWLICTIIRIKKMTPEQRNEQLKTYLKGLIAFAEKAFVGPGRGAEKLQYVIENFNKHAPIFMQLLLMLTGTESLEELIEKALQELKENFEK